MKAEQTADSSVIEVTIDVNDTGGTMEESITEGTLEQSITDKQVEESTEDVHIEEESISIVEGTQDDVVKVDTEETTSKESSGYGYNIMDALSDWSGVYLIIIK